MRKMTTLLLVVVLGALLLAACGNNGGEIVGDPARGEDLYHRSTLGSKSAEGCVACHAYNASDGDDSKAPFTEGTATRAETRVPGLTAEEYLHESIVNPDAYVVEGYDAGGMYQHWADDLTEQQIADLVAFLLTQK